MQFKCKQIECKLVSSLVVPNTIEQQSNELRTRSGAKELMALLIVSAMQDQSNKQMPELGKEHVKTVDGEKLLERDVQEQSQSSLMLNQFVGAERGRTQMFVGTRVTLMSPIILALMAMIMSIGGVDGFMVERDILESTMNWRREMMGSSIKNSNVEVAISQNPVEALRNNLLVAQSSHKGLIKSTGVTGRGEGLLCQGLFLDEAQALFNANDRMSKAGREVIDASATRTNTGVSVTNDNEDVDFKLHNSPMTSEVLSDSLFNAGILSDHQFNLGILSNCYHLKAGDLSKLHVHKLSDFHASLASSSSDDNLSLSDSQALSPFKLSGRVTTCHCHRHSNSLAYQSVTTCHWYHQTNCLASQRVTTCHRYSSVTTCHCLSNLTTYHCHPSVTTCHSVSLANCQLFSPRLTSSWTLCLISQLYARLG
jgi:hypothetical protein